MFSPYEGILVSATDFICFYAYLNYRCRIPDAKVCKTAYKCWEKKDAQNLCVLGKLPYFFSELAET
jgi:hypothetical protein